MKNSQEEKFWNGMLNEKEEDALRASSDIHSELGIYFQAMEKMKGEFEETGDRKVILPERRLFPKARIINLAASFLLICSMAVLWFVYGPGDRNPSDQAQVLTESERIATAKAIAMIEDKYFASMKMTSARIHQIEKTKNLAKLNID